MEFTDYAYCRETGEIRRAMDVGLIIPDPCRYKFLTYLPIPQKFKAYVKDDTAAHGLEGKTVELVYNPIYSYDFKKTGCIWFTTNSSGWSSMNVSSNDIDFDTIDNGSDNTVKEVDGKPIIHPSLEELQHCNITFKKRKTIVTYYNSYVGEAICHEDDTFDVNTGIAVAYTRAYKSKMEFDKKQKEELAKKEIKIGDTVKVIDPGANYSSYLEWVYKNVKDFNLVKNYAYDDFLTTSLDRKGKFTVKVLGETDGIKVAYIQSNDSKKCHLINLSAIKKVIK